MPQYPPARHRPPREWKTSGGRQRTTSRSVTPGGGSPAPLPGCEASNAASPALHPRRAPARGAATLRGHTQHRQPSRGAHRATIASRAGNARLIGERLHQIVGGNHRRTTVTSPTRASLQAQRCRLTERRVPSVSGEPDAPARIRACPAETGAHQRHRSYATEAILTQRERHHVPSGGTLMPRALPQRESGREHQTQAVGVRRVAMLPGISQLHQVDAIPAGR